jgi:hypothetical protein
MPPKGKGRKSNIEAYRDAMAIVKLVDHDCMEVADAAKALGLTLRTAYRLLSRARGVLLTPQIEADKKAAEPKVNQWFEPAFSPEPSQAPSPVEDGTVVVPAIPVAVPPQVPTPEPEPEPEVWEWEHLKPYREFMSWPEHRRKQWLAQVRENEALGGVRWTPALRGGIKNRTCFRGCPSYQCTCEDNL